MVAVVLLVGIGYSIGGHPAALLWSGGVAAILVAPEILEWIMRPRRTPRPEHWSTGSPWYYLAVIGAGLAGMAWYPLLWAAHATDRLGQSVRSAFNVPIGLLTIGGGLVVVISASLAWYRDVRNTRADQRATSEDTPPAKPS